MKIRIFETDFEGHPVECTGEFFAGENALSIVEQLCMNPFLASLPPLEFMRLTLDRIGQESFMLPEIPEQAAEVFLQQLAASGYAAEVTEEEELFLASIQIAQKSEMQVKMQK